MMYAVSHPGRARLHGFGIFGGSNGFWRTDLLREIRMRDSMLTEDIDAALRAVEAGHVITSDPYLVSRELSPTTLKGLTHQRLRWAQGWYQVTKLRMGPSLVAPKLSLRQKFGMFHLLAWREAFPWLSMQIVPVIGYWMWRAGSITAVDWFVPLLVWISLFIVATGPGQLLFTWIKADPQIKKHTSWFWFYFVLSIVFYAGYKNIVARVANLKEFLGEKAWKVTPRS
jgi:cellulose synthase/poly-beta-1,6-N-acetylglucosamine synthase-like glycosyltransferase